MILQAKSVRVATIWGFCARYLSHSFVLFISNLFWAYPWRHAKYGVQIYWEIVENWGIHIRFSISCESDSLSAFTCGTVFRSMAFCIFFSEQVWLAKPFALHLQTDITAARMVEPSPLLFQHRGAAQQFLISTQAARWRGRLILSEILSSRREINRKYNLYQIWLGWHKIW